MAETLRRLERTEMQMWRRIVGVSLMNGLSNEDLGIEELKSGITKLTWEEVFSKDMRALGQKPKLTQNREEWKRRLNVLISALNFVSDGEIVREVGRVFQKKGPKKAKADLAKECLTRVKKKREQEDDRRRKS
ncbi:hypothetical protein HELRODRAFT_177513 [Helobdella robusta]|uniref:Uncharacterized protein n=1 Tax=Helobdella robusta TaxID=6412 RepID=T1FBT8_HELRO|nr:hypothetical protein HELRODRAFT_177513 [Helobdella robusta]ESN97871.1 hypothetical protein HELRODRAFT_177513 [Helobdella robusta]